MSNIKLQKVILGPDWIDLGYGEPRLIMSALMQELNRVGTRFTMPTLQDLNSYEYQPSKGNTQLVAFLENKFKAKVLVANGAKQALAAVLYAFKQQGYNRVYYSIPYYPAMPSIVEGVGMTSIHDENLRGEPDVLTLITSPNNPDGVSVSNDEAKEIAAKFPVLHDAAYYTPIYLPDGQKPEPIGKVQVFSLSKMYGVSGLRIGYAVFHDNSMYQHACDYVEKTTAGVSASSQHLVLKIEDFFSNNPERLLSFESTAKDLIALSKKELSHLDPEALIPTECNSNSMFVWCSKGPKLDLNAAKVAVVDGAVFGKPNMVRLNVSHPAHLIRDAVNRINSNKIKL